MTTSCSKIQRLLIANVKAHGALDALVHDHASQLATAINNDGLTSQLSFLLEQGLDAKDVLYLIEKEIS